MHHASSTTDWCRGQSCKGFPDPIFLFVILYFLIVLLNILYSYILVFLFFSKRLVQGAVLQRISWCNLFICILFYCILSFSSFIFCILYFYILVFLCILPKTVCAQQCFAENLSRLCESPGLDALFFEMHLLALFRWHYCLTVSLGWAGEKYHS